MFKAALCRITKSWKQPTCVWTADWRGKVRKTPKTTRSSIKRSEGLAHEWSLVNTTLYEKPVTKYHVYLQEIFRSNIGNTCIYE